MSEWALFDNPRTRRRELWSDGRITSMVTEECLTQADPAALKTLRIPRPMLDGGWQSGNLKGSPLAISAEEWNAQESDSEP
jgi:hypothetical protein